MHPNNNITIAGCGLSGMISALALASNNIPSTIIEKKSCKDKRHFFFFTCVFAQVSHLLYRLYLLSNGKEATVVNLVMATAVVVVVGANEGQKAEKQACF